MSRSARSLNLPVNKNAADVDVLLRASPPAFSSFYIEEPQLVFGGGHTSVNPKEGIALFGPLDVDIHRGKVVRVGVIGTGRGIDAFKKYLDARRRETLPGNNSRGNPYDAICFPPFPGAAATAGFRVDFETDSTIQREIPLKYFEHAVRPGSASTKIREVVDLITKRLEVMSSQEPAPDVVVIVLPDCVEKECRLIGNEHRTTRIVLSPIQKIIKSFEREKANKRQDMLALDFHEEPKSGAHGFWNIHHAVKAHAMAHGLTTQFSWESMLRGETLTQDPASAAWNFFTALFYKAGNIPWRLQQLPENTCFVGISFYKEGPHQDANMQTSLAQVFSGNGEGIVLKGEPAPVSRKGDKRAHLDAFGAQRLLKRAIDAYTSFHNDQKPARVVVHKSSRFWEEELAGFRLALDGIPRHDLVALNYQDQRFMRLGNKPPLRGTVITLADGHHLMWTTGYVPCLREYPGMRVPKPLEIIEHVGDSTAETICREILSLTKVNWNSCAFASSEPITLLFARTVGRILAELPPGSDPPQTKYKFYM